MLLYALICSYVLLLLYSYALMLLCSYALVLLCSYDLCPYALVLFTTRNDEELKDFFGGVPREDAEG